MPKAPSVRPRSGAARPLRNPPLIDQLQPDTAARRNRINKKGADKPNEDEDVAVTASAAAVDSRTSRRILDMARQQQLDIAASDAPPVTARPTLTKMPNYSDDDDDDENDDNDIVDDNDDFPDGDYEEFDVDITDLDVNPDDQELIERFMSKEPRVQTNLSDLIMSKIEQATAIAAKDPSAAVKKPSTMNPKVVEVYTKVGILLSRYRSGPLPKPFKIIPTLRDWEEVLAMTNPSEWSPQAFYQATRIFASNLKTKMAQRFFNIVLLERVRTEIQDTKKLNYHVFMAIKKALYKPAAFFKGFLLPLCESGTCTLREAVIIGSVLTKVSIPPLHSSATLLKIAQMEYTGPNSLFIRLLLDKKYALPYMVIDSLVFHFLRFRECDAVLPVLWHQSLLTFVQRYKEDITADQKDAVLDLVRVKHHPTITAEIRREFFNCVSRGLAVDQPNQDDIEMGTVF